MHVLGHTTVVYAYSSSVEKKTSSVEKKWASAASSRPGRGADSTRRLGIFLFLNYWLL